MGNMVEESTNMSWYKGFDIEQKVEKNMPMVKKNGKTLKDALDAVMLPKRPYQKPLRMAVFDVCNEIMETGPVITGVVRCGSIKPGMAVNFAPSNITGVVQSVQMYKEDIPEGVTGDNIGVHVVLDPKDANPEDADPEDADPEDADPDDANPEDAGINLKRGMVVSDMGNDPARETLGFYAQVIILNHPGEIHAGYAPVFDIGTAHVSCKFKLITEKIDRRSGRTLEVNPEMIKSGDAAMALFVPLKPLVVEKFSEYKRLGRFAVRDMRQTVAVGVVKEVLKKGDEEDYVDENGEIDWHTWLAEVKDQDVKKVALPLPEEF